MGEYINKYANAAAIQSAVDGGELIKPYVALDESTGLIDWNTKFIDYANMPLTFEILSDGDLNVNATGVSYSINDGEWLTTASNPTTLPLSSGDKIKFKANGKTQDVFQNNTIQFNAYGNVMSLVNASTYPSLTSVGMSVFQNTFKNCTGLTDASKLLLPATTLKQYCYGGFNRGMFQGCTSLTTAPELPATTLARNCYYWMFFGCSNLNYIKCLATDISAADCTYGWLSGVSSTGTFITPSSTNWSTGNNGIPTNWTRVDA